jgi:hypothetical protein
MTITQTPPSLCPPHQRIAEVLGPWFVLEVLQRHEKSLAWELSERGIGYYLPLAQRIRRHGGQLRRVVLPLFGGYLFVAGGARVESELLDRQEHPEVIDLIHVADQKRLIGELASLQAALAHHPSLGELIEVPAGSRHRVVAGPLQGIEVIICQCTGRTVLAVNVLNRAVEIEIDAAMLEAA